MILKDFFETPPSTKVAQIDALVESIKNDWGPRVLLPDFPQNSVCTQMISRITALAESIKGSPELTNYIATLSEDGIEGLLRERLWRINTDTE